MLEPRSRKLLALRPERGEQAQPAPAPAAALCLTPGQGLGEVAEDGGRASRFVGDHLAIVRRAAEKRWVECDGGDRLELEGGCEVLHLDLRPLWHADLVEDELR